MNKYIVQTAAAAMPQSCWGVYRRIGVLEVGANTQGVTMISERARGVRRVVKTWERLSVGKTERCAYRRALREAQDLVIVLALSTGFAALAGGASPTART